MDSSIKIKTENIFLSRDRDNKNKLFENIIYFASGSISHDVLQALKNNKAESTCLLSDSVTHCIVGDNYIDDDVTTARDLYDVITVTPEWIRMCVLCNKLLPTKPFNPFEENLFHGVVVCASQLTVNDCKTLWAIVTYNGGTFRLSLDLSETTHLVITKPYGKKYESVLASGIDEIKIVTPDWIIDCVKNKELCPEINYHPRLLVMPKLSHTNSSFKLQTSGLSTITGFVDFDAPVEQPGTVVSKNQGLEQLKQRLPWNQPSTPATSQTIQVIKYFQYGLLVWGSLRDNILNALVVNQNNIVRICLNKFTLEGSTKANYRELGVLPRRLLYKKIAIMNLVKKFNLDKYHKESSNKRELRKFDLTVNYTNLLVKNKCFVDYLGPTFFNSVPFDLKKKIFVDERINIKGLVYKYLFLELNNELL